MHNSLFNHLLKGAENEISASFFIQKNFFSKNIKLAKLIRVFPCELNNFCFD